VAALSISVLLVVVPLIVGRSEGWPVWSWAALAASLPAFALFLATQRAAAASDRNPLVNVAVIARRPVALGLLALLTATGTYYALLFTLAQYFQSGLARSALASGLILVPWVAAFGVAGQVARRLPPRLAAHLPVVGYLVLATAYLAIAAALLAGRSPDVVLGVLLALGGFGLGTGFATMIGRLTSAVPTRYAPDISGVSTTVLQIGGAIGVAASGASTSARPPAAVPDPPATRSP
jgi:predicted MFS family arabinose efflux permease